MTADEDKTRIGATQPNDLTDQLATILGGAVEGDQSLQSQYQDGVLRAGTVLNYTYRIGELLGRGGMGEIYSASHVELGTQHAIKVIRRELSDDPKITALFRREAGVLRNLRHDAVVAYDGLFRDEFGRMYLVMELVDGPSLAELLTDGPLRPADIGVLRNRIASGLAKAHDNGVVHRDISPENIIIPERNFEKAKIIDFGVAKLADITEETILGSDFAGKYSYVSPEQLGMFGGEIDGRSDIYSLGLVLAACSAGRPLDMGNSPASVVEARQTVPDLTSLPSALAQDLTVMLQPDPAKRHNSVRNIISKAAGGKANKARPATLAWIAAGLGLAVVAAAGYWYSFGNFSVDLVVNIFSDPGPGATQTADPPTEGDSKEPSPSQDAKQLPTQDLEPAKSPQNDKASETIPSRAALIRTLDETLALIMNHGGCGAIGGTLVGADSAVALFGYLASQAQKNDILAALRNVHQITTIDTKAVRIVADSNCAYLRRIEQAGISRSALNSVEMVHFGARTRAVELSFQEGEELNFSLLSPNFPSYIYADYFDESGKLSHLYPSNAVSDVLFEQDRTILLNKLSGESWKISEPFGLDLIVAFATSAPLFLESQPDQQQGSAADHQERIMRSLENLRATEPGFQAEATIIFVETRPKP